ncbi:hypothetical protein D1872_273300 [compost metagenome]
MRHVNDGLNRPLESAAAHFVQEQSYEHRHDKAGNDFHQGNKHGVPNHLPKPGQIEQVLEIVHSDPVDVLETGNRRKVLKGNGESCHRNVTEYNDDEQSGQNHEMKRDVTYPLFVIQTHMLSPPSH